MSNEHVQELIPGYALGCLDAEELELVKSHIKKCEQCRVELTEFQDIASELAYAVPEVSPRFIVKKQIMIRVRGDISGESQENQSWLHNLLRRSIQISPAGIMAGLTVIVILLLGNVLIWQKYSTQQALPINTAEGNILRVVTLVGTDKAPLSRGTIIISMDGEQGALVVDELPVLADEFQYQLWLIKDGERTSGGIFSVDEHGYGGLYVKSPIPLDSYNSFGITIEPSGGSPGPTGDKVMGGDL